MRLPAPHKNQNGVAAVEFAILLPLLAVILFGTLDFALLFYNKQVLTNASRELARYAIVADNAENDPDFATQIADIKNFCDTRLINLGGNSNNLTDDPEVLTDTPSANYITATITYEYDHLFSGITGFGNTTLTGQTVMRME